MKVLVIGSGGREHALVWKIAQSKKVDKTYCAPGNPGTSELAENIALDVLDLTGLLKFAKDNNIGLTVVGPENPLIDGIVDLFTKNNLAIIGPNKNAARIEGSKVFAKKLLLKYKIPTADFAVFDDYHYAHKYIKTHAYPLVIKADGQCFGKGVTVCYSENEAVKFLKLIMLDKVYGQSGNQVIIEECLIGQEVSFMVATDGKDFVTFLTSQDHKRIFDDDRGPNTGGIGAYAPVPFVDKKLINKIEKEIVAPTIKAMVKEGCLYQGILYPGIIITREGPKVLEFNCRFGDPETQPLLMLLKTDLIDIFEAIVEKRIKNLKLDWYRGFSACVVMTSKGYPGDYDKEKIIYGLPKPFTRGPLANTVSIFHSGTKQVAGKVVTNGGRVLGITAFGKNLNSALKNVYKNIGINGVHFSGMHYRKDIGKNGLIKHFESLINYTMRLTYKKSGVDYSLLDPVKKLAQKEGLKTRVNLKSTEFKEVSESRGETAYILESDDCYFAFVEEGLGTKNLIADEMRKVTGKTYYDVVAYDAVISIIMDLTTVGAKPISVMSYWAVGDSNWFADRKRMHDFIKGWKKACDFVGVSWGGGETPTLSNIINPKTIDLAGAGFGIIKPKNRIVLGDKLRTGDVIILFESSGIHVNGLTLARKISDKLPLKYATRLSNGITYGESLLIPTLSYTNMVEELLNKIDIHYMVNITGHGWRKIMRAIKNFTYVINDIGDVPPLFTFIQEHSGLSDSEMYATFNMGAGFAIMTDQSQVKKTIEIADKHKIKCWVGGKIRKGAKQVIIRSKNIIYTNRDLKIR